VIAELEKAGLVASVLAWQNDRQYAVEARRK
jgi:hypothetical protein